MRKLQKSAFLTDQIVTLNGSNLKNGNKLGASSTLSIIGSSGTDFVPESGDDMDDKRTTLDPREARPLTSREIAKIISAVFFAFTSWCDIKDITDAMDHFSRHVEVYKNMLKHMEIINKKVLR